MDTSDVGLRCANSIYPSPEVAPTDTASRLPDAHERGGKGGKA